MLQTPRSPSASMLVAWSDGITTMSSYVKRAVATIHALPIYLQPPLAGRRTNLSPYDAAFGTRNYDTIESSALRISIQSTFVPAPLLNLQIQDDSRSLAAKFKRILVPSR